MLLTADSISYVNVDGYPEIVVVDINFSINSDLVFSCDSMQIWFSSSEYYDSIVAISSLATDSVRWDATTV